MDMASLAEGVSVSSSKRTDRLFFCSDKNRSKVESTNGAFTFERRLWSKARSFSLNVFVDDTSLSSFVAQALEATRSGDDDGDDSLETKGN
mmetsp:Transcript_25679/g.53017  ORF Transcript_25679/g.53017 Transcript_25679/m.53017 type:complete len:91 (-) Transcript_25679:494-766(-)